MRLIFLGLTLFLAQVFAQLDQVHGQIGVFIFPQDEKISPTGFPENAFSGYRPAISLGFGQSYYLSDKFRFSGSLDFANSAKPYYTLNLVQLTPSLAFHPFDFDRKISPYLFVNGTINFMNIVQSQHVYTAVPQNTDPNAVIQREDIRNEPFQLITPVFGGGAGFGIDATLKKRWGMFAQISQNIILTNASNFIKNSLKYNTSNMVTTNVQIGLRYRFVYLED